MTAMDLLPTFAKLAGAELPTDRVLDGKDVMPVLTEEAAGPHEAIFYHRVSRLCAVRSGKWKLHTGQGGPQGRVNGEGLFMISMLILEKRKTSSKTIPMWPSVCKS